MVLRENFGKTCLHYGFFFSVFTAGFPSSVMQWPFQGVGVLGRRPQSRRAGAGEGAVGGQCLFIQKTQVGRGLEEEPFPLKGKVVAGQVSCRPLS